MIITKEELDIRTIPLREKYSTISKRFKDLKVGESFVIISDYDSKQFRNQMDTEYGEAKFSWEYLEDGLDKWKIRIHKKAGCHQ
ncbi:DUF2249 domain-containing protein [Aliifodinibius sp. S!AR15-10]|uniref:DUF2249 domain-containing protein n=1 Tax=Aliifodinibius sp. S!AR15-10 TaxID=2950437 RepID=UPI002862016C|nr:DUF2249 domain-containing protein [Aliifodinibius sp. S!AR15-10]MDR8389967.1 DUF2249 domain-containing protein [Aliifodinibius sp. S!AR15-10]